MSIKHRVFTLSYKRKSSKITKNKQTYKKFTGITTLALYKPQRAEVRQKYIKAKPKNIKPFTLKPHTINRFRAKIIENEYKFARNDINKFKDYVSPQGVKNLKELKSFKAFLPKHIWEKMSRNERETHLKKRRELQARGLVIKDKNKKGRLKISKNIIKFSHRLVRPVLNSLKFTERRNYLKSLVQTAKFIANNTFEDKAKKKKTYYAQTPASQ